MEKRLIAAALVFVVVYLGAAALTIHNRITADRLETRLESAEPLQEERHLMIAELLLPMLILFTVAVSFILVKKKREKVAARMEEDMDPDLGGEWRQADSLEGERRKENA
jgi:hypothetical protein